MVILNYIIVIVLITLSGLFSGLTLGLMGLNTFSLKRKVKLGNKDAATVYPLRKRGNLLLCTLLLGNVAVNSTLAVFLGSITQGVVAGFIATGLIVIFGEILPQAVFSRFALKFGAKTAWLVYLFLFLLYPITKPLAYALDKALGRELPTVYSKKEFSLFLEEQKTLNKSNIKKQEFELLSKGLDFSEKITRDIMTPKRNVFFVKANASINMTLLRKVSKIGHTRIPIYNKNRDDIVGLLYAKDLVTFDPRHSRKTKDLMRKRVYSVKDTDKLSKVFALFKKKRVHLFIVRDHFGALVGIVTLEDILEEIVGEIVDEYDQTSDMRKIEDGM